MFGNLQESVRRWTRRSDRRRAAARLEDRLRDRRNNFDVLRLLAASLVLFSHSYALTASPEPFAVSGWTFGEVGVVMFFAMSGFLIAKSWSDQPGSGTVRRQASATPDPGARGGGVRMVFVVGPLFTTFSAQQLLQRSDDLGVLDPKLVPDHVLGKLPGVFSTNPYPAAVNGSLWTLPVEACCYALAAALGVVGLLRRSGVLIAFSSLLVLCVTPLSPFAVAPIGGTTSGNFPLVVMLGATFVLGVLAYALRSRCT